MAHPDHTPTLDGFDRTTVILYRTGLGIATVGTAFLLPSVILVGVLMSAGNLHLYDKRVRWILLAATLVGAGLSTVQVPIVQQAGLGFLFITLSGLALKERLCFRIPGLAAVPVGLATGLIPLVFGHWLAQMIYALTALPLAILVIAKWRMPLHFDIGNRDHYQI